MLVRPSAVLMAFNLVVAMALAHRAQVRELGKNVPYALELQALFLFGSIAIALLGSGRSNA